jgi:hypothetical protein
MDPTPYQYGGRTAPLRRSPQKNNESSSSRSPDRTVKFTQRTEEELYEERRVDELRRQIKQREQELS